MRDKHALPTVRCSFVLTLTLAAVPLFGQDQPQPSAFYDVAITREEIYSFKDLKFRGDFTSIECASGFLALGRTPAGVTVVIILGPGKVHIEAPEAVQEQFTKVFGAYPLDVTFKSIYMRVHPKDFEATLGKLELTRAPDDAALKKAQDIFGERFIASYHAGPKALLPPQRTRVLDMDLEGHGLVCTEEGYWIRLNRMSPYGKVYPRDFVNPKK